MYGDSFAVAGITRLRKCFAVFLIHNSSSSSDGIDGQHICHPEIEGSGITQHLSKNPNRSTYQSIGKLFPTLLLHLHHIPPALSISELR